MNSATDRGSSDASTERRSLPEGALQLLILQPTPFCNIDCEYCYLPNRDSKVRMGPDVLRASLDRVFESGLVGPDGFTIVWHAGEPLVLGVDWYREALAIVEARVPKGVAVHHSIQSNGMLLDDAWCEFLKSSHIQIGLSLDGPAALHDARRKTRSGKGTLAPALRGLAKLREHGMDFHVISVLTRAALMFPDELFEFYVDHGISRVGFNVEEIEGGHHASSLLSKDVDQKYRAFLRRFFALVKRYGGPLSVRELSSAFETLHAPPSDQRDQQNAPFSIVSVAVDGGFTTYSPELLGITSEAWGDFTFGNVLRDSFEDGTKSERFRAMSAEVEAGVAKCKATCRYYGFCGGGAPANKFFENGSFDSTETLYCRLTRKALFDVCAELAAKELEARVA